MQPSFIYYTLTIMEEKKEKKEKRPKYGGRKKGTPNRSTTVSRELFNGIVSGYIESEKFKEDLNAVEPKDRLDVILKLSAFLVPKPQSIAIDLGTETKRTIEDKLRELARENEH